MYSKGNGRPLRVLSSRGGCLTEYSGCNRTDWIGARVDGKVIHILSQWSEEMRVTRNTDDVGDRISFPSFLPSPNLTYPVCSKRQKWVLFFVEGLYSFLSKITPSCLYVEISQRNRVLQFYAR